MTQGGRLSYAANTTIAFGGVDPHRANGDSVVSITNSFNVFEALTRQDADGNFRNWLLDDISADDDSAAVWTLKLKQGVLFHNNKEMKADDVIFSLRRIHEPGTVTAGHIGAVKSYEKLDDHTVRLILEGPRSWLPIGLGDPYSSIVPVDFDPQRPIGTGAFKMKDIVLNDHATIEKFDRYWGVQANLDEVMIYGFPDPSTQLGALQAGQIDVMADIDTSLIGELEGDDSLKIYDSASGRFYPIGMRTDVPPFNDVRLRLAMRLVIDREAVINSVFNGYATVGNDLYGRYDPDYDAALVRKRDVAAAKALVEEAGASGLAVDLFMYLDQATALVLAENAKEIGINVSVKQLDGASYFNDELLNRTFFGGDPWPSGPYFLASSLMFGPDASYNQLHFEDKEYLDLWAEANKTLDVAKRRDIVFKMQEVHFERGGWIIAAFPNSVAAYNAKIKDVPDHDYSGAGMSNALRLISMEG